MIFDGADASARLSPARPLSRPPLPADPEFARVLRIGDPTPALDGALTFLPPADATAPAWRQTWTAWLEKVLAPIIAPALMAAAAHASQGQAREILALDQSLASALDTLGAARSAAAGQRLLHRFDGARGDRWLDKLRAAPAREFSAQFPIIYACQSALFHLPGRLIIPGYAYWEWCAALAARRPVSVAVAACDFAASEPFLRRLAESLPLLSPSDAADASKTFRVS